MRIITLHSSDGNHIWNINTMLIHYIKQVPGSPTMIILNTEEIIEVKESLQLIKLLING
jgi:hypothetical protein